MRCTGLRLGASLARFIVVLTACGGGKSTPAFTETAQGAGIALQAAGVYSAQGDQPSIWQFTSPTAATAALKGTQPPLASALGEFTFRCGSLVVVGDSSAKIDSARSALVQHFSDCGSVTALK